MHTPGPWATEYDDYDGWGIVSSRGHDGTAWNMYFVGATKDEMPDNVILMATAPELLDACEAMLQADPHEIVIHDDTGHPLNAHGAARQKMRKAIAKATP